MPGGPPTDQTGVPEGEASRAPPELEEPWLQGGGPSRPSDGGTGRLAEWQALLRNRFILGGLAILVVLLLVTIVLVVLGGGDDDSTPRSSLRPTTPNADTTVVLLTGLRGQVRTTTTMRNGPDTTYAILGTIPKGAVVSVVGRNADDTWLQVTYPPGSQLRGWVSVAFVEVAGDISQLAIADPGAGPSIPIPTGEGGTVLLPTDTPAPLVTEPPPTETPGAATPTPTRLRPATATPQLSPTSQPIPTETPSS